jgi:hypothetical protein
MALLRRLSGDQRRNIRHWSMEFAVVAFGVLAALGAQELAQELHWKSEVRETRKALDAELAYDLAVFEFRMAQKPCIAARLLELNRWTESFRTGAGLPLKRPINQPPEFITRSAVWEVTDGEVASRIPLKARLNYAALYQRMRTFSGYVDAEDTYWDTLPTYENSKTLDQEGQRAVERAIGRLNDSNSGMDIMKTGMEREANALGIRPEANIESSANPMIAEGNRRICLPLL